MSDPELENKLRKGGGKVKKDLNSLVEDGVSEISERLDRLKDDARETVVGATTMAKKDVGHVLNQYNNKAGEIADKVPGGLNEKINKYPWVAISIALALGFFLGNLFKPGRQH